MKFNFSISSAIVTDLFKTLETVLMYKRKFKKVCRKLGIIILEGIKVQWGKERSENPFLAACHLR